MANVNQAPRILPMPLQLVQEGETLSFVVRAADADQDAVRLALQYDADTPEGWTPGRDVIVPPPKTPAAIAARKGEGYAMKDWYFSTRKL